MCTDIRLDDERERVFGGDGFHRAQIARKRRHAARHAARTLVREDDVIRRERLAVVPLHAGA
jgi:hypothetical protein